MKSHICFLNFFASELKPFIPLSLLLQEQFEKFTLFVFMSPPSDKPFAIIFCKSKASDAFFVQPCLRFINSFLLSIAYIMDSAAIAKQLQDEATKLYFVKMSSLSFSLVNLRKKNLNKSRKRSPNDVETPESTFHCILAATGTQLDLRQFNFHKHGTKLALNLLQNVLLYLLVDAK